jgi:hypothetical protein
MAILCVSTFSHNNKLIDLLSAGANTTVASGKITCDLTANANVGNGQIQCPAPSGTGARSWEQFMFRFSATPSAEVRFWQFNISGYADTTYLTLGTDGKIRCYRGTTLDGTSTNALSPNTNYWLKIESYFPGGESVINVDVDGTEFAAFSPYGAVTSNAPFIGDTCPAGSNFGTTLYYWNVFINDISGTNWTTEPTGQPEFKVQSPTGTGDNDHANWVGSPETTDKYKNWDEFPPNGTGTTDSDFNYQGYTDLKLTSTMPTASTMGLTGKTIAAICVKGWGRRAGDGKEHHGAMIRMDNTDLLAGGQVVWATTSYADSIYAGTPGAAGFIRTTNESAAALTTADFDDWEIGWYTFTSSGEAHGVGIYISGVWAEIAYFTPSTGTKTQINIGDIFKTVTTYQLNIGDVWKPVTKVQQNIGDTWKSVF